MNILTFGYMMLAGAAQTAVSLISIAITAANGGTTVASSGTLQFSVTGTFSDSTTSNLTQYTSWTITSGGSYGSIDSNGLFTAGSVVDNTLVTVSATTTYGGVTKSNTFNLTITSSVVTTDTYFNSIVVLLNGE